ncbi:MAG: acetyl-CoA carboxylase carboxyltransferase subunit beta [Fibrobacteres bacterium]|nr:acetyl-CoA carboxylase carboxyltransferase subunit beta [Fibrobacterota bacterium]
MEWFKNTKSGILNTKKREIKDNLWLKCEKCTAIIYKKELEKHAWTCPTCSAHFRVSSLQYRQIMLDPNSFQEMDQNMSSVDVIGFKDKKAYADRIVENNKKTGLKDAVVTGIGLLNRRRIAFGAMDFDYMGGSMGSVVGEKIARLIVRATQEELPLIIVSASGGARMQEGTYSLMQMAKTSAALSLFEMKKLPFISVLTHPTTGGTTASFAMLGDIHIAEPGALIGFAGPRVIRETIRQELPEGFQRSEFLLEHGFVDLICDRRDMKERIAKILSHLLGDSKLEPLAEKEKSDLYVDIEGNLKRQMA